MCPKVRSTRRAEKAVVVLLCSRFRTISRSQGRECPSNPPTWDTTTQHAFCLPFPHSLHVSPPHRTWHYKNAELAETTWPDPRERERGKREREKEIEREQEKAERAPRWLQHPRTLIRSRLPVTLSQFRKRLRFRTAGARESDRTFWLRSHFPPSPSNI